jgi:FkbM family methyltransferase
VKTITKHLLKRSGFVVKRVPPDAITGYDLAQDLKLIVAKRAPVCIDVGANRGQTIEYFQRAFREPRIHAFEPSGECFRVLKSKDFGGDVSLYNFALGEDDAKREFTNYENPCLSSFLVFDDHQENRFRDMKVKRRETVQIKTLDWFVEHNGITRVDLLKIDTQGYDLRVLAGGSESFRNGSINSVLVELNFVRMYDGQSDPDDIHDFLAQYGLFLVDYYEKVRQSHTLAWCTALFAKR